MNTLTKLQVAAGLAAVIALPMIYFGLHNGSAALPWTGIMLFLLAMLVTPTVRILPSGWINGQECADV